MDNTNNREFVNNFTDSLAYLNQHRPKICFEYLSNPNDSRLYDAVTERNWKHCESFLEDQRNEEFKKHFENLRDNIRNFDILINGGITLLS